MNPKLLIPEFLCGKEAVVRRHARRVIRRAIVEGGIPQVMASETFIHIDDAPGQIILDHVEPWLTDDHVLLEPFAEVLLELLRSPDDRNGWYERSRRLHWEILDEFWACLIMLAESDRMLPIKTRYDNQRPHDCRSVLRKMLKWWPDFCALDDRFYDGMLHPEPGYRWGRATWGLLRGMGQEHVISELKELDVEDAGARIREVVGHDPNDRLL
jgi:hypothetical protein